MACRVRAPGDCLVQVQYRDRPQFLLSKPHTWLPDTGPPEPARGKPAVICHTSDTICEHCARDLSLTPMTTSCLLCLSCCVNHWTSAPRAFRRRSGDMTATESRGTANGCAQQPTTMATVSDPPVRPAKKRPHSASFFPLLLRFARAFVFLSPMTSAS